MRLRMWLIVLLLGLLPLLAHAQDKTVRLLTVGNSFADNALTYLPQLADAAGDHLIVQRANLSGCSLERHWKHAVSYLADPAQAAGKPYQQGRFSLAELLQKEPWDVVTIQQYSLISHDLASYQPYARYLHDYIHKLAPQATVLLHQTWAYRADDPRFRPGSNSAQPTTQQAMHEQVRAAYHAIAQELGVGLIPSGDAMHLADTHPQWGYQPDPQFDVSQWTPPALPEQTHSLHVGWIWRMPKDSSGSPKLVLDGHHAGKAGRYLVGCVWYEVLFGRSVVDNRFVPSDLDAEYAAFLRQTAHQAVEQLKAAGKGSGGER